MKTKFKIKIIISLILVLLLSATVYAAPEANAGANSSGRIIIIILDVSTSMDSDKNPFTFEEVKEVIYDSVVKKHLKQDDYFVFIKFGETNSTRSLYSGRIGRERDITETIKGHFEELKANNKATDIGTALETGLEEIINIREDFKQYKNFEPIVIFVTDGDHWVKSMHNSPYYNENTQGPMEIGNIFESNKLIGNKNLYLGWLFVGIHREPEKLKDIRKIAELSGRENYLITIDDPKKLEKKLEEMLPDEPIKLDTGEITVNEIQLGDNTLDKAKSVKLVLKEEYKAQLILSSSYEELEPRIELQSMKLIHQLSDNSPSTEITVSNLEEGFIVVKPQESGQASANIKIADLSKLKGEGTLKFDITYTVDNVEKNALLQYGVNFITPSEAFWDMWFIPLIVLIILILLVIAFFVIKALLPVKVVMDVGDRAGRTQRAVSFSVGESNEIGIKPGIPFKLEGNFAPVIGSLKRVSKDSWEVIIKDKVFFKEAPSSGKLSYNMGSYVYLVGRDGAEKSIRFILKNASSSSGSNKSGRRGSSSSSSSRRSSGSSSSSGGRRRR